MVENTIALILESTVNSTVGYQTVNPACIVLTQLTWGTSNWQYNAINFEVAVIMLKRGAK